MKSILLCMTLIACTSSEENLGDTVTSNARWALALGQRGYETSSAVAIDSHGDVVVAGSGGLAAADLGNGTIGNDTQSWGFLTKRSGLDGGPMWTLGYASPDGSNAQITAVAIDRDDSILVTGEYGGTLSFGAGPVGPSSGMFIAKYSTAGALIWLQTLTGATGNAIGVDAAGNVFVGANYNRSTVEFMGTQHTESDGNGASMVLSYSRDGMPRWGNFLDAPARTVMSGLAISQTGDVVATGSFSTTISFGNGAIMNPDADQRGFVARYHGDGSFMWADAIGPTGTNRNRTFLGGVTIDSLDRIIIDGDEASAAFADNTSPAVNVLDAGGSPQWTYSGHTNDSMPFGGLVVRADGTIVTSAWIDDVSTNTSGKLQLREFDMNGNMATSSLGKRLLAAGRTTLIRASALGPSGEIAVVGDLSGEITIAQGPIESHGTDDTDAMVVMVEP